MLLKTPLILFTTMLITTVVFSQTGVTLKFKKDKPVQIVAYERLYDREHTGTSKSKLKKRSDLTDAEVAEIFDRLDKEEALLPAKIDRTGFEKYLPHYVAYQLSDFSLMGFDFALIWIPYEDNQHMPADLQPPTKDGSIFYTYKKHLSFDGKKKDGTALAKAGTPCTNNEQKINVSTADMSEFLNKESSVSGYQTETTTPTSTTKKKYRKCSYCKGKGYITITKKTQSTSGGVGKVGSTGYVDWERAPTTTTHESKESKTCEFCKGSGEVEE